MEKLKEINQDGYDAYYENRSQSANPNPEGTDEYRAWDAGWLRAKQDSEED